MRVAVLAGGKGTRLGEPIKCLTEVAGRPFMDWKLEQLERCGATSVRLIVGPFLSEFRKRYGNRCLYLEDSQTGIRDALARWDGWWSMGDVFLEQPLDEFGDVVFVRPGVQVGGLWLDCGLYRGRGPWRMVETQAVPYHLNTPDDLAHCEAYLRGAP